MLYFSYWLACLAGAWSRHRVAHPSKANEAHRCRWIHSSIARPTVRRCSRNPNRGFFARRAMYSSNRACARKLVPLRILSACSRSVVRIASAAVTMAGKRSSSRKMTPSASATTKSELVSTKGPTRAHDRASGERGSTRWGPVGTVPREKIGSPISINSSVSR